MTASTASLGVTARVSSGTVPMLAVAGGLHVHAFDAVSVATTSIDEVNDIVELGFLPPGITVHGFIIKATDMDSGTPALAYKLQIGTTDVVTGITTGQSAATAAFYCDPTAVTAITVVQMKITTVAATAVAGTVTLRVLYTAAGG